MANNTGDLKKFAQSARRQLREQVAGRLEQVLRTDSAELRQKEAAIKELKQQIAQTSKKAVIDRVAYTWFNRFCALRFMDVNRYTRIGIVSPAEGYSQPEILQEAKQGYIDEELNRFVNRQGILDLLSGKIPSKDPQQEAYRLLLVGVCNSYNTIMPFLFERIEDYTELLMPLDLLSDNSILHDLREVMTPEACQDVEIIGWLYQYYISERKDEVFEALKQNQKIEAEDIPAATQLFTPHWIVRYLVENSLGRLWMLNRPKSRLVEKMEFYIKPIQEETDFVKVSTPEEIKICDPACGSGHMLTYAFDLLYSIYEEEGYASTDIPGLILHNNLFGIEIDERAGALAAFALFMKARSKDKRFIIRNTQPNICVLENVSFTDQELNEYMDAVGRDLFTEPLRQTLKQFEKADNFGSLIRPILTDATYAHQMLKVKNLVNNLFLFGIHERVLKVLRQAQYLSPYYDVVVTNPPYMGNKGINSDLREFASDNYEYSKSDIFAMFIVRSLELTKPGGYLGLMTPFTWMFLSSYNDLRSKILDNYTLASLIRPEYHAFFESAYVPICTFVIHTAPFKEYPGTYIDLTRFYGSDIQALKVIEAINNPNCNWLYHSPSSDFKKIPGMPIAYWLSEKILSLYENPLLGNFFTGKIGVGTSNDDLFIRMFWEVSKHNIGANKRWILIDKAGNFRKWYMGFTYVMDWENDGYRIRNYRNPDGSLRSRPQNTQYLFLEGVSWGMIGSGITSFRWRPEGFGFNNAAPTIFGEKVKYTLGSLNSKVIRYLLSVKGATLNMTTGMIEEIPFLRGRDEYQEKIENLVNCAIESEMQDWNLSETSWDFQEFILMHETSRAQSLVQNYEKNRILWQKNTLEMMNIELEINRLFINSYDLINDLSPDVPMEEITLTCNPYYRYGGKKNKEELEELLLADTMKEFISYSVGCMFGRYSLDKPGLILANQGETLQDYLRQIPDPTFTPDEDNAIPILDGDWFSDDITERFKKFLRITFGEEHYDENLAFIEDAIGRDIRSYFLKDFYTYHVKMYQKRPIYWLFSSPKGSFNVLIYMHRYNKDTISVILNRYLREFRAKLEAHKSYLEQISISVSASPKEKTSALKDIEKLSQTLEELRVYERDVLYPLATQRIEIDLDDGVKVNYAKFGKALRPI